ncbi:GNAT family N-acetyltransferase [Butyrivibrio sp. INlla16]|uniref:GNAT family N-acetyltransferase n=1 Tax=Butyrivibrio sp. INlla16 TaxID=1520807 RepID=UPI000884D4F9|nr:GNAT family protein [Butyrivibrio sp. INlla16]SDB65828.1 Protein N-acetyltransferase, RimJ/RimL family [Butyrivibrio sp. INlla16]
MNIRPFEIDTDFDIIKDWITDERTHAMWSANRMVYPLDRTDLQQVLAEMHDKFGDKSFVAVKDDGSVAGFFCYSLNNDAKEGMLKFIVVDPQCRGKGRAEEMIKLALADAFDNPYTDAVQLNVFSENVRAKKFYEKIGFKERRTAENAFAYKDESWDRCNMVIWGAGT